MYSETESKIVKLKDSECNINKMDSNPEVISKLKFIGRLKKGDKINTRHMYVQSEGFGTSFSRTFLHQDNRNNAYSFCKDTINRAFELLITFERSENNVDKFLFYNLINDLNQAIIGLSNLKYTYITDTKFCCDMDTLLESIHARLKQYDTEKIIN